MNTTMTRNQLWNKLKELNKTYNINSKGLYKSKQFILEKLHDLIESKNLTMSDYINCEEKEEKPKLKKHKILLVGHTFENRHVKINRLRKGEVLTIMKEPQNKYDEHAIKVVNEKNQTLGYFARKINKSKYFKNIDNKKIDNYELIRQYDKNTLLVKFST